MSNKEIISKRQLETETKYAYCPYCYKEKKSQLKSFEVKDVLPKLYNIKTKETYIDHKTNDVKVIFDTYQHCENCGRDITIDDFYRFYVAKADGTPFFDPPKKQE